MNNPNITRRVFIGATAYLVTVPVFATLLDKTNHLLKIVDKGQFFDESELTVLTDIAEIMIPKTDTPGATDAQVVSTLDGLMLTWANKVTQAQFKSAIVRIQQLSQSTYQGSYQTLSLANRQQLLVQLDKAAFANKHTALSTDYRRLKELVFHIYYSSEQANPDFVLIPRRYYGDLTQQQLHRVQQGGSL